MLAMSKRLNFKRFCVDLVCTVLPSENTDSDYCYCVLGLICLFLMLILFYEATNRKKIQQFFLFFERTSKKKPHSQTLAQYKLFRASFKNHFCPFAPY